MIFELKAVLRQLYGLVLWLMLCHCMSQMTVALDSSLLIVAVAVFDRVSDSTVL